MKNPLFRWLLFIPGGLVAGQACRILWASLARSLHAGVYGQTPDVWQTTIVPELVFGMVAVYVGVWIAPTRKALAALIVAGVTCLMAVWASVVFVSQGDQTRLYGVIAALAGCGVAVVANLRTRIGRA